MKYLIIFLFYATFVRCRYQVPQVVTDTYKKISETVDELQDEFTKITNPSKNPHVRNAIRLSSHLQYSYDHVLEEAVKKICYANILRVNQCNENLDAKTVVKICLHADKNGVADQVISFENYVACNQKYLTELFEHYQNLWENMKDSKTVAEKMNALIVAELMKDASMIEMTEEFNQTLNSQEKLFHDNLLRVQHSYSILPELPKKCETTSYPAMILESFLNYNVERCAKLILYT